MPSAVIACPACTEKSSSELVLLIFCRWTRLSYSLDLLRQHHVLVCTSTPSLA